MARLIACDRKKQALMFV